MPPQSSDLTQEAVRQVLARAILDESIPLKDRGKMAADLLYRTDQIGGAIAEERPDDDPAEMKAEIAQLLADKDIRLILELDAVGKP